MVRPGNPDEEHLEKVLSRSVLRQGNTYKPDGPKPVIPLSSGQKRNLAKKTKKHKEAPPLKDWYGMKKPKLTPEIRDDLFLIKNRALFREKSREWRWGVPDNIPTPTYFEMGKIIPGAVDFHSSKGKRNHRVVDELLTQDHAKALMHSHRKYEKDGKRAQAWNRASRPPGSKAPKKKTHQRQERTPWGSKI
jgi:hypothetical protein